MCSMRCHPAHALSIDLDVVPTPFQAQALLPPPLPLPLARPTRRPSSRMRCHSHVKSRALRASAPATRARHLVKTLTRATWLIIWRVLGECGELLIFLLKLLIVLGVWRILRRRKECFGIRRLAPSPRRLRVRTRTRARWGTSPSGNRNRRLPAERRQRRQRRQRHVRARRAGPLAQG